MKNHILEQYIKEVIKEAEYLEIEDLPDDSNSMTWGDLRKIVEAIKKSYKTKDAVKKTIKALSLVPGFAMIGKIDNQLVAEIAEIGIAKVLGYLYNINGKKPQNKSSFQIDPDISNLIDDKAEKQFIFWLADECKKYDDDEKLVDFNMTQALQEWLENEGSSEYGGANVKK